MKDKITKLISDYEEKISLAISDVDKKKLEIEELISNEKPCINEKYELIIIDKKISLYYIFQSDLYKLMRK